MSNNQKDGLYNNNSFSYHEWCMMTANGVEPGNMKGLYNLEILPGAIKTHNRSISRISALENAKYKKYVSFLNVLKFSTSSISALYSATHKKVSTCFKYSVMPVKIIFKSLYEATFYSFTLQYLVKPPSPWIQSCICWGIEATNWWGTPVNLWFSHLLF